MSRTAPRTTTRPRRESGSETTARPAEKAGTGIYGGMDMEANTMEDWEYIIASELASEAYTMNDWIEDMEEMAEGMDL